MMHVRDLLLGPLVVSVSAIKQGRNRSRINENATRHILSSGPCWSRGRRVQKAFLCKAASHPTARRNRREQRRALRGQFPTSYVLSPWRWPQGARIQVSKVLLSSWASLITCY